MNLNKRNLLGYSVASILVLTLTACGSTTSTPKMVTVVQTVTQAPAECGTALDLAAEFATAVSTEHQAMSDAAAQAGQDGDIATMVQGFTTAMAAMNNTISTISQPIAAAAQVCRAAIK
jgi:hypothetical protein